MERQDDSTNPAPVTCQAMCRLSMLSAAWCVDRDAPSPATQLLLARLALAHARDGIRVNCVCPGFVETDMWTVVAREQGALLGLSPEEFTRQRLAQVPLGRMERPEDVASVIAFLASSRAGYMTGQAISVDGGLVMH